jgi:hypothetical protein
MLTKYINKIYIKIVQNIIIFLIQSESESSNYIFIIETAFFKRLTVLIKYFIKFVRSLKYF